MFADVCGPRMRGQARINTSLQRHFAYLRGSLGWQPRVRILRGHIASFCQVEFAEHFRPIRSRNRNATDLTRNFTRGGYCSEPDQEQTTLISNFWKKNNTIIRCAIFNFRSMISINRTRDVNIDGKFEKVDNEVSGERRKIRGEKRADKRRGTTTETQRKTIEFRRNGAERSVRVFVSFVGVGRR